MENYFKNEFSTQLLCETLNHPNIKAGVFTYYAGFYHQHAFEGCVRYLDKKRKDVDKLIIGNYCSIGSGAVFVMAGNQGHRADWLSTFPFYYQANIFKEAKNPYQKVGDTLVGHDVWIGAEAMIMSGVQIGSGAIIASRAVITKDVAPYAIMGGNPATLIKYRFSKEKITMLLALKWWNWEEAKIKKNMPLLCSNSFQL